MLFLDLNKNQKMKIQGKKVKSKRKNLVKMLQLLKIKKELTLAIFIASQ